MRTIKLTIEYVGTDYAGWQRQTGCATIQGAVESALEKHLGHRVRLRGSGRTDSGVHALGQVASFSTASTMPVQGIGRGLVPYLPRDIGIVDAAEVPANFDARSSARLRWYRYFISTRAVRPVVGSRYLTHYGYPVDLERMRQAAEVLAGDHDFSAFRSISCQARRTRLTLLPIRIAGLDRDVLQLDLQCRSFLHNMVRIMTATLLAAGRDRISPEEISGMLETGQRHKEAVTIPPQGLFLYRVFYEEDLVSVPVVSESSRY